MKSLILIALVFTSFTAKADWDQDRRDGRDGRGGGRYQQGSATVTLNAGSSAVFYDYNSRQDVQVYCERTQLPPPPPPVQPTGPACELKFNPSGNSCMSYVIYKSGTAVTGCIGTLTDAAAKTQQLVEAGVCSYPQQPSLCETKFNPSGNSCMSYVIYKGGSPVSGCLGNDLGKVTEVKRLLVQMGACAQ